MRRILLSVLVAACLLSPARAENAITVTHKDAWPCGAGEEANITRPTTNLCVEADCRNNRWVPIEGSIELILEQQNSWYPWEGWEEIEYKTERFTLAPYELRMISLMKWSTNDSPVDYANIYRVRLKINWIVPPFPSDDPAYPEQTINVYDGCPADIVEWWWFWEPPENPDDWDEEEEDPCDDENPDGDA